MVMSVTVLVLTLFSYAVYCGTDSSQYDYGFVIDAGSTGSRIYAYQWKQRSSTDSSIPPESRPKEYGDRLTGGPLSDIKSLTDAKMLLIPFIEHVKNITYSERFKWNEFPIYLKATAGMRLLDKTDRTNIFNWIRKVFANETINPFLFQNEYSIIASGTEEATFDWLSVNYLKNVLVDNAKEPQEITYGALDLGGGSTQIAFAPIPSSDIIDSFLMTQPFNYPYRLYTMSHLGYGANEIERQIAEKVYSENNNMNPCYYKGLNRTLDFIRYNGIRIYNVTQTGTADGELCEQYLKDLLYLDQPNCVFFDSGEECSVNGVYIPTLPPDMNWVGFSAFAYTILADKHGINETSTLAEIYDVGLNTICKYSWHELNIVLPGLYAPETLCLLNLYIVVLLRDGYHFDINKRNILWTNEINDSNLGWQWGSILYDANLLDYEFICNNTNTTSNDTKNDNELQLYKILAFIFVILFGVAVIVMTALVYMLKKKKSHNIEYIGGDKTKAIDEI